MGLRDKKIAIVGAGMTAASCAHLLGQSGAAIDIFEKSRGAGGRMATRRLDNDVTADHGAQYFTSETEDFSTFIGDMIKSGDIAEWPVRDDKTCYVGAAHMNSPIKSVLALHNLQTGHLVTNVEQRKNQWWLTVNDTIHGPYDYVISTIPVAQATALTAAAKLGFDDTLNKVSVAPCWALMLVFEERLPIDIKSWRGNDEIISWIGRNSSKTGRDFKADSWTVHANPEWSQQNLELSPKDAADQIFEAFIYTMGAAPEPLIKTAHRWRYAQTVKPLGEPYLSNASNTFFVGGDWCLGGKVEYAFESGAQIAQAILDQYG